MANEWHYTLNGQQAGAPITSAQLKQLAAAGQLQPTDMVWQEGMADWVPASSIKGLFGGKDASPTGAAPPPMVVPVAAPRSVSNGPARMPTPVPLDDDRRPRPADRPDPGPSFWQRPQTWAIARIIIWGIAGFLLFVLAVLVLLTKYDNALQQAGFAAQIAALGVAVYGGARAATFILDDVRRLVTGRRDDHTGP
jgi:hypothetical protein